MEGVAGSGVEYRPIASCHLIFGRGGRAARNWHSPPPRHTRFIMCGARLAGGRAGALLEAARQNAPTTIGRPRWSIWHVCSPRAIIRICPPAALRAFALPPGTKRISWLRSQNRPNFHFSWPPDRTNNRPGPAEPVDEPRPLLRNRRIVFPSPLKWSPSRQPLKMEEEFKLLELENRWEEYFKLLFVRSRKHSADIGDSNANKPFNRYIDVLPYDRSRIKLTRTNDSDYINANLVTVPRAARQYILTQGPLPDTVSHFWLMVWEQKSTVIVMLNKCVEMEKFIKCEQYWPASIGAKHEYPDVRLTVTLEAVDEMKHFTVRRLLVQDKESEKTRQVSQFQYKAWPDHDQPDSPTSFLRLLTAVRKSGGLDKMDEPTIVHCSAGIGRSGTFCLIDSVLSMVENQGSTEGIEISNTLIEMRDYRMGLIQSPVQLRFAYMSIIYGIKVLESANKLQPHMSSMSALDKASQNQKSTNGTSAQSNGKKSRRNRKKPGSSNNSTSLNVFNKHQLVEAMDEIDSDDADALFEDSMKHLPSLKKARNSEPESLDFLARLEELANTGPAQGTQEKGEQQITAKTKAQLLTDAINNLLAESKVSQNTDLPPNSTTVNQNTDSVLLRRRERELRNQRLAEKTLDIKNRMKAEELKKERRATKLAFMKKSALFGGVALLLSSIAYVYLHGH